MYPDFFYRFWSIDDPRVVSELQHAEDGSEDAVPQAKSESLVSQLGLPPLSISLKAVQRVSNVIDLFLHKLHICQVWSIPQSFLLSSVMENH